MKLAIMSDTHDNLRAVKYFVEFFNEMEAEALLHAGDFISPFTIPALAKFRGPVVGVFGNNDGDRETLRDRAEGTSVDLYQAPHEFTFGDCQGIMAHRPVDLPDSTPTETDLVIHGHTHEPLVENQEDHIRVNPGEAGGWLTDTSRAILFDTASKSITPEMVPAP